MVPEEKAKFERMAAEDRERYNKECAVSICNVCLSVGLLLLYFMIC